MAGFDMKSWSFSYACRFSSVQAKVWSFLVILCRMPVDFAWWPRFSPNHAMLPRNDFNSAAEDGRVLRRTASRSARGIEIRWFRRSALRPKTINSFANIVSFSRFIFHPCCISRSKILDKLFKTSSSLLPVTSTSSAYRIYLLVAFARVLVRATSNHFAEQLKPIVARVYTRRDGRLGIPVSQPVINSVEGESFRQWYAFARSNDAAL